MIRKIPLLPAVLALGIGCSKAPARFSTSDAPPLETQDDSPLLPHQVPIQSPADARHRLEMTTSRFLLALQNRAPEQLETLLAADATVRDHASASGTPALPTLLELTSTWSGEDSNSDTRVLPFGPVQVVELETRGKEAWATVDVGGPPKVRGLWKVRLGDGYNALQVKEVILPKGN